MEDKDSWWKDDANAQDSGEADFGTRTTQSDASNFEVISVSEDFKPRLQTNTKNVKKNPNL